MIVYDFVVMNSLCNVTFIGCMDPKYEKLKASVSFMRSLLWPLNYCLRLNK